MKKFRSIQANMLQRPAQVAEYLDTLAARIHPQADFTHNLESELMTRWDVIYERHAPMRQPHKTLDFGFWILDVFQGRMTMLKRLTLAISLVVLVVLALPLWPRTQPEEALPLLPRLVSAQSGGATIADGLLSGAELLLSVALPKSPEAVPVYRATSDFPTTAAALAWARDFDLTDPQVYRNPHDTEAVYVRGKDGRMLMFRMAGPAGGLHYTDDAAHGTPGNLPTSEHAVDVAVSFLSAHHLLPADYVALADEEDLMGNRSSERLVLVNTVLEGHAVVGDGQTIRVRVNGEDEVVYANIPLFAFTRLHGYPIKSAEQAWAELLDGGAFRLETEHHAPGAEDVYRTFRRLPHHKLGDVVTVTDTVQLLVPVSDDQPVWAQVYAQDGARYTLSDIPDAQALLHVSYPTLQVRGTLVENLGPHAWRLDVSHWETATPAPLQRWVGVFIREGQAAYLVDDAGERYRLPEPPAEVESGARVEIAALPDAVRNGVLDWLYLSTPPYGERDDVTTLGNTVSVAVQVEPEATLPATPEPPFAPGEHVVVTGTLHIARIIEEERQQLGVTCVVADETGYPLVATAARLEALTPYHRLHVQIQGTAVMTKVAEGYPATLAIQVEAFRKLWPDEERYRFIGEIAVENIAGHEVAVFTECDSQKRYVLGPQVQALGRDYASRRQRGLGAWYEVKGSVHADGQYEGLPIIYLEGTHGGSSVATMPCSPPKLLEPEPQIVDVSQRPAVVAMQNAFTVDRVELAYYYAPQFSSSSPDKPPQPLEAVLVQPVWIFSGHSHDGATTFTAYVQAVRERYVADTHPETPAGVAPARIIRGTVVSVSEEALVIEHKDRGLIILRLNVNTRIWKGRWDEPLPLEVGDEVIGYGDPNLEGTVYELEQLEVNLVNVRGTVLSVTETSTGLDIVLDDVHTGKVVVHILPETLVIEGAESVPFAESTFALEPGEGLHLTGLRLKDGTVNAVQTF